MMGEVKTRLQGYLQGQCPGQEHRPDPKFLAAGTAREAGPKSFAELESQYWQMIFYFIYTEQSQGLHPCCPLTPRAGTPE